MLFDFIQDQHHPMISSSRPQTAEMGRHAGVYSAPAPANIEILLPVSDSEESSEHAAPIKPKTTSKRSKPAQRSGRWTPDEKILFLYGLKRFGKGRWKKMSTFLPHRYVRQFLIVHCTRKGIQESAPVV
jgi:hypothetical protein